MRTRRHAALLLVCACQAPTADSSASATMPAITSVSDGSSSTGSSSSSSTTSTTTDGSGTAGASADTTSEPARDLGAPDFGDGKPAGCQGKIDFLFVISRDGNMFFRQAQLAAAVPKFIDTIAEKFADFDYHIMVIDGDGPPPSMWWGDVTCNELCPNLACRVGEPCCPYNDGKLQGEPCCIDPNYPCDDLDLVRECDSAWGAGTVFPAGKGTADKKCPIDKGRRYLVKGQTDLNATFECIAMIGNSGYGFLGNALMAAMEPSINAVGGCNQGFLRDDALLMVTTIYTNPDQDSNGWAAKYAKTITAAKGGNDEAVVALNIGRTYCDGDRICDMVKLFPYHHVYDSGAPDYAAGFDVAAGLVETACAGFSPPG